MDVSQLRKGGNHLYPCEQMMPPYEKLKSLPQAQAFLKVGITFKQLDEIAYAISDNEAAKQQLFNTITEQHHRAA